MEHLRKMYKLMNLVLPLKDSVNIIIGCIQRGYIDVPVLDNGKYLVRKHSQGSGMNVPVSHNHTVLNTWPCPFCPHAAPLLSWNKDRPRPITPPLFQLTNKFFMSQDIRPPGPMHWIVTCYDGWFWKCEDCEWTLYLPVASFSGNSRLLNRLQPQGDIM